MAWAVGSGPVTASVSGTTVTLTLTGTTIGRHIIVGVNWLHATATITSIACSGESNLTKHGTPAHLSSQSYNSQLASLANNTAGGTKTITVTMSTSGTNATAWAMEVSGGNTGSFLQDVQQATADNTANPTVNVTSGTAGSLLIGTVHSSNSETVGSGFTNIPMNDLAVFSNAEYNLDAGTAGTETINFTSGATAGNDDWAIAGAVFNPDPSITIVGSGGALALTGFAPTLSQGSPSPNLTPTAGSLAFSGQMPVLTIPNVGLPVAGSLALSGAAPTVGVSYYNGEGTLETITGFGVGLPSTDGAGVGTFEFMTATGVIDIVNLADGLSTLEAVTGIGYGSIDGAGTLSKVTGIGRSDVPAIGVGTLEAIVVYDTAGAVFLERITGYGVGYATVPNLYSTKVMNARTNAITEYTNYGFNSFAKIGDSYYGASSSGLILLEGDTDLGQNIDWTFTTGQLDDRSVELKRLPEILFGLRANGPIRVRVNKDDNISFSYTMAAVKINTLHQARVKPGKGLRSRYYAITVSGISNSAVEIDSMVLNFSKTNRRLG